MSDTPDILFAFLKDLMYNLDGAKLDIDSLDEQFKDLGKGLEYFAYCLQELKEFAAALARGDLSRELPSHGNELTAPLKSLHSNLRHLTWQSKQVAKGDYRQRVNFMGEFSEAFNLMIQQLDARQQDLTREIEISQAKTLALEQSNNLLADITSKIPQMIIVIGKDTGEILYKNVSADSGICIAPGLTGRLIEINERSGPDKEASEFSLNTENGPRYYSCSFYSLHWDGADSAAFVVNDISDDVAHVRELEMRAYRDTLTGLYNRFSGMQTLHQWLDEGVNFSMCFVDLDNLKFVNDTYGHSEGDRYIIDSAELLKSCSPDTVVCRLGGDEFMLLSPDYSPSEMEAKMQELSVLAQKQSSPDLRPYLISLSYGIVGVNDSFRPPASELLSLADERMYEHKKNRKMSRRT